MTHPTHAALVEEVAKKLWLADESVDGQPWSGAPKYWRGKLRDDARAILSLIAARLSDVTPEMVEAVSKAILSISNKGGWSPAGEARAQAHAAITAYLAASPLTPGEKGEG